MYIYIYIRIYKYMYTYVLCMNLLTLVTKTTGPVLWILNNQDPPVEMR